MWFEIEMSGYYDDEIPSKEELERDIKCDYDLMETMAKHVFNGFKGDVCNEWGHVETVDPKAKEVIINALLALQPLMYKHKRAEPKVGVVCNECMHGSGLCEEHSGSQPAFFYVVCPKCKTRHEFNERVYNIPCGCGVTLSGHITLS